jgi:hypothetical protein
MLKYFETGPLKSKKIGAGVKASAEHSLGDSIFGRDQRKTGVPVKILITHRENTWD